MLNNGRFRMLKLNLYFVVYNSTKIWIRKYEKTNLNINHRSTVVFL
jgi:hypothetical protein